MRRIVFPKRLALALVLSTVASLVTAAAEDLDEITRLVMPAPYEVTATGVGPAAIAITWKDVSRTEQAFQIQWTKTPTVDNSWAPATELPLDPVKANCDFDNTGTPPYVNAGAEDGNYLNQYNDPRPARCSYVLTFLRNKANTNNIPFPFAESGDTEYWFRIRGIFPFKQKIPGTNNSVDFPAAVRGLVHSPWSGMDPAILGPVPPANVTLFPLSVNSVTVAWANAAAGDPYFQQNVVERYLGLTLAGQTLPSTSTTFTDTGLEFDKHYRYRVVAKRIKTISKPADPNTGADADPAHQEESFSPSHDVNGMLTFTTPPHPAPAQPTGLTATFTAPSTANLQWMDNSNDEDGFLIEFGPADGNWLAQTAVGPHNGTGFVAFSQFGIAPDTIRWYRVFAYHVTPYAKSDPSNSDDIVAIPKAPSDLVELSSTSFQTTLRFKDNSVVETGFKVEFCNPALFGCSDTGNDGWLAVPATLPASPGSGGLVTFTDGRFAATTLRYRARAFNASGDSAPSNAIGSTTPTAPLNAPSNLVATAHPSDAHTISLTWQDNTNNADGQPGTPDDQEESFRIEYQDPGRAWLTLTTVGTNVTSYVDTTVPGRRTRCYRVRAVRASDNRISDPSNTSCATTVSGPKPPAPTNLLARPWDCMPRFDSLGRPLCNPTMVVELEWVDQSPGAANPNEDYFSVEHSTDLTSWAEIARAPQNTQLYRVPRHFEPASVHYFRVKAVNFNGESAYTNVAQVQLLGPPRPVWLHPSKDNTVATTACSVDGSFTLGFNPPVNDIMVQIVRKVGLDTGTYTCYSTPGSCKYDKSTPIPEIPNQPNQVQMNWNGAGTFKLDFHFRKNVTYELHAKAINADGASADAFIATFVVLGDCPIGG